MFHLPVVFSECLGVDGGPTLYREHRLSQNHSELTLTPATFSEGWWLLSPWSSAKLRSFKSELFKFKTWGKYLDWDVNHHIMAELGLGEYTEVKLVVDTGLLVSRKLQHFSFKSTCSSKHWRCYHVILPARQIPPYPPHDRLHIAYLPMCSPLYGNNVAPEEKSFRSVTLWLFVGNLSVRVAKASMSYVQTVPVFCPVVPKRFT